MPSYRNQVANKSSFNSLNGIEASSPSNFSWDSLQLPYGLYQGSSSKEDDGVLQAETYDQLKMIEIVSEHGVKMKACPVCNYASIHITNVKKHMLTHTKTKPYGCSYCSYRSIQKANVKTHIARLHTPQNTENSQRYPAKPPHHDSSF